MGNIGDGVEFVCRMEPWADVVSWRWNFVSRCRSWCNQNLPVGLKNAPLLSPRNKSDDSRVQYSAVLSSTYWGWIGHYFVYQREYLTFCTNHFTLYMTVMVRPLWCCHRRCQSCPWFSSPTVAVVWSHANEASPSICNYIDSYDGYLARIVC